MKTAAILLGAFGLLMAGHSGTGPPAGAGHPAAPAAAHLTAASWWAPANSGPDNGPEWVWELDHPLDVHNAKDLGAGAVNAAGQVSSHPTVYDIDGIENPAATVTALHSMGYKAVCYVEIGSAGDYYTAAAEGTATTYYAQLKSHGDLGRKMPGYNEYYLNLKAASTVTIVESMIRQQCAAKGFDAVEPDIGDSYTDSTGFGITEAQNVAYDNTLGAYAHSLGLGWGQKNGDNDPAFAAGQEPVADFLLTEECNYYRTCSIVTPPYVQAGKLVLNAEYMADWGGNAAADLSKFCPADAAGHLDGTLFGTALSGQRNPCS
jgi:hypothetical protein